MKNRIPLTLCAALLFSIPLWAQQDQEAPPKTESAAAEAQSEKDNEPAVKDRVEPATKQNTQERFVPSEEVSEDLSISFPADI